MNGTTPRRVIPTEMKWSGGIFPRNKFYLTQVIFAAWEDSSTPLCYGRNDMSGRWFRFIHTGCFRNVAGTALRPFPTVSLAGGFFQPHRLYSKRPRNGTQAVPYDFADRWYRSTALLMFVTGPRFPSDASKNRSSKKGRPVFWYTGRDSNPQPSEPESDALSIEPPVHFLSTKVL